MSAVEKHGADYGLCGSAESWTHEDQQIARRRLPRKVQAFYATSDFGDYCTACAYRLHGGFVRGALAHDHCEHEIPYRAVQS